MEAIIFIGIQATGKTSFYKERFFKTHIRINLDMLRTRNREKILVHACLDAKQPFVIDNTNPKPATRARYIELAKSHRFHVTGYYFQSSLQTAIGRNNKRSDDERIPEKGILNTYNQLQVPSLAEGFDVLQYVMMDGSGGFVVKEWEDEV